MVSESATRKGRRGVSTPRVAARFGEFTALALPDPA
jgi:hypothetical protein